MDPCRSGRADSEPAVELTQDKTYDLHMKRPVSWLVLEINALTIAEVKLIYFPLS